VIAADIHTVAFFDTCLPLMQYSSCSAADDTVQKGEE
jgi:hypothetical protein